MTDRKFWRGESLAARRQRLGHCNGFDLLRLLLAAGIIAFHSLTISNGSSDAMPEWLQASARLILPGFFALSGYLVAGSLERCASLREFMLLRVLRVLPALTVVVALTALVLGPLLTRLPVAEYLRDPLLRVYFGNLIGQPEFYLPGLFAGHPRPGVVNGALWTVPLEMACYVMLALAGALWRGRAANLFLLLAVAVLATPLAQSLACPELFAAFAAGVLLHRTARSLPLHAAAGSAAWLAAFLLASDPAYLPMAAAPLAYGIVWLGSRRLPAWLTRDDYSYGLYLTAYPLQQAVVSLVPGISWWLDFAAGLLLALCCATALWHGVEKPVLSRKHQIIAGFARASLVRLPVTAG